MIVGRLQKNKIFKDLDSKIVLLYGPRQAGKTTLAKSLSSDFEYLNFDRTRDRSIILQESWVRKKDLIIFDELHKMKKWKSWIKGIYDTEGVTPKLLVTGSARLDLYRKGGDSLAGRFFGHRLYPFSIAELKQLHVSEDVSDLQERLMSLSGFPEPFLSKSEESANRWRRSHLDSILREDLLDLEKVRDLKSIEILIDLLAERVGRTVSYSSLAQDLQVSSHTVKSWIQVLERLYIIFIVTPYAKNIARALLKEPKIYFYDCARVTDQGGARFENLVACSLLKRNHYREDIFGDRYALHYVRDHQKREVDFFTLKNNKSEFLIEVKTSDDSLAPALKYFTKILEPQKSIQLVKNLYREKQFDAISILSSAPWLSKLEI
ncbi:MAG: ATP-binding protein [Deltaproteobacteria bacterium]|nr:ATP-binding protein [Deltaproteobacteria bacterium]